MKNVIYLSILLFLSTIVTISTGCKKNNPPPAPVISTILPSSGLAGASVTINGSNFDASAAGNTVKFNGSAATVISSSGNTLIATLPAGGSTGTVTVTTTAGTATGPVFTYLQAPVISTINPISAKAGTAITITGTNFDPVVANNSVKFNGTAATITSATSTSLVVTAPAGGSTGAVTETTSGGTATGPVFTYLQAPAISGISPASGVAGASITITGTNFDVTAANDIVKFNGTTAAVTSATATQLVVVAPTGGSSGNVTVTTLVGTSNAFAFTYVASTGAGIYVVGSDTRYGYGYWQNSKFTAVADWLNPYGMVGVGADIYVAGVSTAHTPNYWKNSIATQLSSQTGYTVSVAITGTNIYCLGTANNTWNVWKNGTAQALTTIVTDIISGGANGMAISNSGDVYVAGARYLSRSTILKATYWKNGVPVDITNGVSSGSAQATAVYISGSDVYIAGTEEIRDATTGGVVNKAPRLWKNGVAVSMSTPANSLFNDVSCISVFGSDVYVGGRYNGTGAVWKNGSMINIAGYALAENVSSIFLYNNTDLYVTGASSSSGNNCYWKNGNFVEMDPGCTVASSNCAATFANQVLSIYVK